MLRFLKNLFKSSMECKENYDMLDLLAYECTVLVDMLNDENSEEEKEKILQNYLLRTDIMYQSVPDFKEDLDWFNVTEPLTFSESLRGKVVILDFFTYCCINCMHILPNLKSLEKLYSVEDGLVVIGVHSAKFDNEKDSSNILSAVQRYDITHPVVNDHTSSMWTELNIKCWPTLLVLGPSANPLFIIMGEGHADLLKMYTSAALKYYNNLNMLKKTSLPLNPSTDLLMSSNLKFPGKIICSKDDTNLDCAELFAISDSGNHRILIVNSFGDVLQKVGGKTSGFIDGDFKTARFNSPQGVAFRNDHILFVADTENHAIRVINLKTRLVSTVVGSGEQGGDRVGGESGKNQDISSPWDVVCYKTRDLDMSFHMDESSVQEKETVLITMAGTHQIWSLFLDDVIWWKFKKYPAMACASIIGNGHEENRNNSYPHNASFAQPSGLALDREAKALYIADSESSSIRKAFLGDGRVVPLAGGDRNPQNLFAFGDVDGKQYAAKFQHPLDCAFNQKENAVYVADTYNHKIKKIDVGTTNVTTCAIKDSRGEIYQFNEPGGLCLNSTRDILYVADTNNHSIEVVDLKTLTTKTLKLNFDVVKHAVPADDTVKLGTLKINPNNAKVKLSFAIALEENVTLTDGAPQSWNVYLPNELYFVDKQNGSVSIENKIDIDITVPQREAGQEDTINISLKVNLCSKNLCFSKIFDINIPLLFEEQGLDCIIEDVAVILSEKGIKI